MTTPECCQATLSGMNSTRRLSTLCLCLAALWVALPRGLHAAEPPEELFKRALFEEEGRRNYDAAMRGYEAVVRAMDDQRRLAASAVFRLGECYRKLGRTNDAIAQYQRVLSEFQSEADLGQLCEQNLFALRGGMGTSNRGLAVGPDTPATAEEEDRIRAIQALVANSPDLVNASVSGGPTPLEDAAAKGQMRVARFLLDHGAQVDAGSGRSTPLYEATKAGHMAMVELMLQHGANANADLGNGWRPLHGAAARGFVEVARVLLANGADIDAVCQSGVVRLPSGVNGTVSGTALFAATVAHRPGMVRFLLDMGADPNPRGASPAVPLAAAESMELVTLLLERGADPNADGGHRLFKAVDDGDLDLVRVLLAAGARPNTEPRDGMTPLLRAVQRGDARAITELLLEHGADINHVATGPGIAPIHWIAEASSLDELSWALDHGADPNLRSKAGQTPLERVRPSQRGSAPAEAPEGMAPPGVAVQVEVAQAVSPPLPSLPPIPAIPSVVPAPYQAPPAIFARTGMSSPNKGNGGDERWAKTFLLLARGADPNLPFSDGYRLVHFLARIALPEDWERLAARKLDLNARGPKGETALMIAVANQNEPTVDWLLRAGAEVNALHEQNGSALHLAAMFFSTNLVKRLIDAGARTDLRTATGATPAELVAQPPTLQRLEPLGMPNILPMMAMPGGRPRRASATPERLQILEWLAPEAARADGKVEIFGMIRGSFDVALGQTITVSQALQAYEAPPAADLRRVRVHRAGQGDQTNRVWIVDVSRALRSGDGAKDVVLQPGDRIEVPERNL